MPTRPVEVSRADGVGADGEEGHEAQVEQAGQAQRDVQAEAQQHEQRHEGDDLGEERAQRRAGRAGRGPATRTASGPMTSRRWRGGRASTLCLGLWSPGRAARCPNVDEEAR